MQQELRWMKLQGSSSLQKFPHLVNLFKSVKVNVRVTVTSFLFQVVFYFILPLPLREKNGIWIFSLGISEAAGLS